MSKETEIEKEKKRQAKIDRERAELLRYIKSLPAFKQWLLYSKEMGSYEDRWKYFGSEKGSKELRKRFGQTLDKTPKNWDEVELDLQQNRGSWLKTFVEILDKLITAYAGM